jgi:hypothetical protein
MNKLKAAVDRSEYDDYEFLNFQIEGFWLDEKLDELYPGKNFKGLVPTLREMAEPEEQAIVWERIFPMEGEKTICPILMCPDDCDFSCTIVVAEIENWGEVVVWNRIGLNIPVSITAATVGIKVEWFTKVGTLEFSKEDYETMLAHFKKE